MAIELPGGILKQTDVRETITNTEETSVNFDLVYAKYVASSPVMAITTKGFFITPDGGQMFITGNTSIISIRKFNTPWDVTSLVSVGTLDVTAKSDNTTGIFLNPQGEKMYISDIADANIYEYNLTTAWDVSTAVYYQTFDTSGEDATPAGIYFREDGKRMYVCGNTADQIFEYNLPTPWDISTATHIDDQGFVDGSSVFFSKEGTLCFAALSTNVMHYYNVTTAWRISTIVDDTGFSTTPLKNIKGIHFRENGSIMYILEGDAAGNAQVQQYDIRRGWK